MSQTSCEKYKDVEDGGFQKSKEKHWWVIYFVLKQYSVYCRINEHLKVDWTHSSGHLFYIYSTRYYSLGYFG